MVALALCPTNAVEFVIRLLYFLHDGWIIEILSNWTMGITMFCQVCAKIMIKTISTERSSNKCKNEVTKKYSEHGNILNKKWRNYQ